MRRRRPDHEDSSHVDRTADWCRSGCSAALSLYDVDPRASDGGCVGARKMAAASRFAAVAAPISPGSSPVRESGRRHLPSAAVQPA